MTIKEVEILVQNSCRYILDDRFCKNRRKNLFCSKHSNIVNNNIQHGNGYDDNINNMRNGTNIHKYLYTGDKKYLRKIDNRFNKVILEKLYHLLKDSDFKKYEIGYESIPDMIVVFNNKQIPLEIKTSINEIRINEEQIKNHIKQFEKNKYCYLLDITP